MAQIRQMLMDLSWRNRIWLAATVLAAVGGIVALVRWNTERDFKPLFAGLSPEDAGMVTAKLKETGVEYRLAGDGSSILAPSGRIAEVRLQLAASGLPKTGRLGLELFDKVNFGASEFA